MADTLFGSDFGTTTPDWRKKWLAETKDEDPFDLTKTPLYQAASQKAESFLAGEVPGFDIQADIAREAQKAASAERTRQQRDLLIQSGLRDTGTYVQEGLIKPAEQEERDRLDFERNLAATRQSMMSANQATGMTAATGLLGLVGQQEATKAQTALGYAGLESGETIAGMNIASAERIAKDENWIRQQGVDLSAAALYGYNDESGQHIMGSAEIAAGQFGLQGKTLEMQQQELFGYTDPTTGQRVPGKMELLSAEDQRAAARLYGYTDPNTGQHIMGELELQADSNAIARQGMKIEEAQVFGYTDDAGTYHPGTLEMAYERLGIDKSAYEDSRIELFGGTNPITGEQVEGRLSLAAKQFGLQEQSLELQTKELFGGYDAQGNWVNGKYQLMTAEDQRAADEFYGYFDESGEWVPGGFEAQKNLLEIQAQFDLQGYNWQAIIGNLENMDPTQAAEVLKSAAVEAGFTYTDENGQLQKGLKPVAESDMAANRADEYIAKAMAGEKLDNGEYEAVAEYGNITQQEVTPIAGNYGEWSEWTYDARNSRSGKRAMRFTDAAWGYLNEHKGDLIRMADGEIYRILDFWEPGEASSDKNKRAYITYENVKTGETITHGGGKVSG